MFRRVILLLLVLGPGLRSPNAQGTVEVEAAAEALLADVNPALPSNAYFTEFMKDQLLWFRQEQERGRVDIRLFHDTAEYSLPPDIVMAIARDRGKDVIVLSKPRLAADLLSTGGLIPPFNARQRNDFVISLIHEILHLRNPSANPRDPAAHAQEERRVWREMTLRAVRPLRKMHQALNPRFEEVDDALRECRDALPCGRLDSLVRLRM